MGKRVVERPWCVITADMIELLRSKGQYRYVLVMQDLFTKWLELKPLRKADGKAVARALEKLILFRWETPEYLLTDNGTEFVNQVLSKTFHAVPTYQPPRTVPIPAAPAPHEIPMWGEIRLRDDTGSKRKAYIPRRQLQLGDVSDYEQQHLRR